MRKKSCKPQKKATALRTPSIEKKSKARKQDVGKGTSRTKDTSASNTVDTKSRRSPATTRRSALKAAINKTDAVDNGSENGSVECASPRDEERDTRHVCTTCGKKCANAGNLKQHMAGHNAKPNSYVCDVCGKVFKNMSSLDVHVIRKHSPKETENLLQCTICDRYFRFKFELKSHLDKHNGIKRFQCPVPTCLKLFSNSSNLRKHELTHSGEQPYECSTCGKRFKRSGALKTHVSVHSGIKPFVCEICGKAFRQKCHLTFHRDNIHDNIKRYVCGFESCGKAFSHGSNLRKHERLHTGEKPYQCETCGEQFSRKTYLLDHQWKHTGEKPHTCTICCKTFIQKGNLTIHMRIHTGEKPFPCGICGHGFTHKSNRDKHMALHQKEGNRPPGQKRMRRKQQDLHKDLETRPLVTPEMQTLQHQGTDSVKKLAETITTLPSGHHIIKDVSGDVITLTVTEELTEETVTSSPGPSTVFIEIKSEVASPAPLDATQEQIGSNSTHPVQPMNQAESGNNTNLSVQPSNLPEPGNTFNPSVKLSNQAEQENYSNPNVPPTPNQWSKQPSDGEAQDSGDGETPGVIQGAQVTIEPGSVPGPGGSGDGLEQVPVKEGESSGRVDEETQTPTAVASKTTPSLPYYPSTGTSELSTLKSYQEAFISLLNVSEAPSNV